MKVETSIRSATTTVSMTTPGRRRRVSGSQLQALEMKQRDV